MKIENYLVREGEKFTLKDRPTGDTGDVPDKDRGKAMLEKNVERIAEIQDALYAEDKQSLLVIFQAMDAAGKDGAIEHVLTGINPQGVSVAAFKQPSDEELDHDYLWRCVKALPERGKIGIFNRSHYEEVLVVRVHDGILQAQHLRDEVKNDKDIWKKRFRQIRNFETHLVENGTRVIKFFLNVSKDEQKRRFIARIDEKEKNWKFSMSDVRERAKWDEYMAAYEEAISGTSTDAAPWYVIPADKKWFARLAVSEAIKQALESMSPKYPVVTEEHRQELLEARKALEAEA
jgi:PPK2 family polyphosphate:nucleotide phosphotransferase